MARIDRAMATPASSRKSASRPAIPLGDSSDPSPDQSAIVSLWDLVQQECSSHARRSVRIQSDGQTGLLFFDAGRIVHAETADAFGEPAALKILAWQSGSFDPCDATWPRSTSISCSVVSLFSRAPTAHPSNLVAFPARPPASDGLPSPADPESWLYADDNGESEVTKPGAVMVDDELSGTVRVGADGTVLESVDGELADAVAYAGRLSELIGELLGLDGFRALECASKEERVMIYADESGGLVGGRVPIGADVGALRNRLGL